LIKPIFSRGPLLSVSCLLWALFSIVLMYTDYHVRVFEPIRRGIGIVISPVFHVMHVRDATHQFWRNHLTPREELLALYDDQKAAFLMLQVQLQKLHSLEQENQQLRFLLQARMHTDVKHSVVANIISIANASDTQEMFVDRGTADGICVGFPVLDAGGVVGQIIATGVHNSRVMLLSDVRSGIPVVNTRTGIRNIVVGDNQPGLLHALYVPTTSDTRPGDFLASSGLGGRYPKNYAVGSIVKINRNTGDRFARVDVKPAARWTSSQAVLILWPSDMPADVGVKRP